MHIYCSINCVEDKICLIRLKTVSYNWSFILEHSQETTDIVFPGSCLRPFPNKILLSVNKEMKLEVINMGQTAMVHYHFQGKPPFVLLLTPMCLIRLLKPSLVNISFDNILKHKVLPPKWCLPISFRTIFQALPSSPRAADHLTTLVMIFGGQRKLCTILTL